MSIDKYSLFGGDEAGDQRTSVDSYNKHGFVVNGVLVQGAVILLPETTLLWNVSTMQDITFESLVALRVLRTKPGAIRLSVAFSVDRVSMYAGTVGVFEGAMNPSPRAASRLN